MAKGKSYFIAGIGTDVGKTVVSAIVSEALSANYWKPVQSGDLDWSDSMKIRSFCSEKVNVLKERFILNTPASPHYAAQIDGVTIRMEDFSIPEVNGNLVIEGAGGLMVPLNNEGDLYLDLIKRWNLPIILVVKHYLGSINHSILSLEMLKSAGLKVHALVFTGESNEASEVAILKRFPIEKVIRIPATTTVNAEFVALQAFKIAHLLV